MLRGLEALSKCPTQSTQPSGARLGVAKNLSIKKLLSQTNWNSIVGIKQKPKTVVKISHLYFAICGTWFCIHLLLNRLKFSLRTQSNLKRKFLRRNWDNNLHLIIGGQYHPWKCFKNCKALCKYAFKYSLGTESWEGCEHNWLKINCSSPQRLSDNQSFLISPSGSRLPNALQTFPQEPDCSHRPRSASPAHMGTVHSGLASSCCRLSTCLKPPGTHNRLFSWLLPLLEGSSGADPTGAGKIATQLWERSGLPEDSIKMGRQAQAALVVPHTLARNGAAQVATCSLP